MKYVLFSLWITLLFSACGTKNSNIDLYKEAEQAKPNIIFIFSDDLSWGDLGVHGQTHFSTPNIDRLALEGLQFSNAYAGSPECAASRASLLTGMHLGHSRVRRNSSVRGQEYLNAEDITVAEILKKAGYKTGFTGKWGVGLPGTEGVPYKQGFDYSFGFYDQFRAHGFYPNYLMENDRKVQIPENYGFDMAKTYTHNKSHEGVHIYDKDGRLIPNGIADPIKAINSQDYIHEKALKFINDSYEDPFFLYYATQLPHGPVITPDISKFQDEPWDQKHKEWAAMMEHLDRHVGEVLKTLEDLQIQDNTLILFGGDNGYSQWGYFNRKRWEDDPIFKNKGPWSHGKFIPRDGGVRVPFFAYWPDIIKPGTTKHVTSLYDFMATAGDLAGVDSVTSDGISFLPTLLGQEDEQLKHDYLYWENCTMNPHAQSLRMDEYFSFRVHPDSLMEVYDLATDPLCKVDISKDKPLVVSKVEGYMKDAHVDSKWYINPGESAEIADAKRAEAKTAGTLQKSIRANSEF